MAIERAKEIKRRRHRRDKVQKLRARIAQTSDPRQRAVLARKLKRVSPYAPIPEA